MKADSVACKTLSNEYKALASRSLTFNIPTLNDRQYCISKEIMDIANYLTKSATLIESTENKQVQIQPGKKAFYKICKFKFNFTANKTESLFLCINRLQRFV